jgi:hypothetical protein
MRKVATVAGRLSHPPQLGRPATVQTSCTPAWPRRGVRTLLSETRRLATVRDGPRDLVGCIFPTRMATVEHVLGRRPGTRAGLACTGPGTGLSLIGDPRWSAAVPDSGPGRDRSPELCAQPQEPGAGITRATPASSAPCARKLSPYAVTPDECQPASLCNTVWRWTTPSGVFGRSLRSVASDAGVPWRSWSAAVRAVIHGSRCYGSR